MKLRKYLFITKVDGKTRCFGLHAEEYLHACRYSLFHHFDRCIDNLNRSKVFYEYFDKYCDLMILNNFHDYNEFLMEGSRLEIDQGFETLPDLLYKE